MKFEVKQKSKNKQVYQLVKELPERVDAITYFFPQFIAEMVLEDVRRSAPEDIPGYPKNLVLRRYDDPLSDSAVGIVVPGYSHSKRLRSEESRRTILLVTAKDPPRGAALSDSAKAKFSAAEVLQKFSPWTMATLPVELDRRFASIRSRRVLRREALRVEERRKADMSGEAGASLRATGVELRRAHPVLLSRRVTEDLAFEVLRREFGINAPHVAHWRPAIRNAKRTYPRKVLKRWMLRWFAVATEKRWRSRGKPLKRDKVSTLRGLQEFQGYIARTALRG